MHTLPPHPNLTRAALRPTIPVESHEAALSRCLPLGHRAKDGRRPDQGMRSESGASALCAAIGNANKLPALAGAYRVSDRGRGDGT